MVGPILPILPDPETQQIILRAKQLEKQGITGEEAVKQATREMVQVKATIIGAPITTTEGIVYPTPTPTVTSTETVTTTTPSGEKIVSQKPTGPSVSGAGLLVSQLPEIILPSGGRGVLTPQGPMAVEEWQRRENIRRYMGYTSEEREKERREAEEAAERAEKKRRELGLTMFGEPPESLDVAKGALESVFDSPELKQLEDFIDRMTVELRGAGFPETARERAEMTVKGTLPVYGISPGLIEEYNKFIEETFKPFFEKTYKPAAEAYGKELMSYYGLKGEYTPEKIKEIQLKMEELEPFQKEAAREYGEYVQTMGFALPKPGETEEQTLQRMRKELEWYRGVTGERRAQAAMVQPEMMDIRYFEDAQRALAETGKELSRITGVLEPIEAYYYQQYGKPLASELLAEAPGRLRPSVFHELIPGVKEVTQMAALAGAQVVGIGEDFMKQVQQFTGFGPAEREAWMELKYRRPVTPISVLGLFGPPHPAAAWAGPEIKLPSAILAGVAGYGLETKAITAGVKPVAKGIYQTGRAAISAMESPTTQLTLRTMMESPKPALRAIEWGRKLPVIGRAFKWQPEMVELSQAEVAKMILAAGGYRETLGFLPTRVSVPKYIYLRQQEFMQTLRAPILAYQTAPAKATFTYLQTGKMERFFGEVLFPQYAARPAPEVLAVLSGQKTWYGGVSAWRTFVVPPDKTLAKFLAPSAKVDVVTAMEKFVGRATMETQTIFEPMRAPFVAGREILGTGIKRAPATLRAIKAGEPLVTRTGLMPSIDITWEYITKPGYLAPTYAVAERTVVPLKMIARPTPETFKLLAHYEEADKELVQAIGRIAGGTKGPSLSDWAKNFMRTFQTRASPARALEPAQVLGKQAGITAFEFAPFIGTPAPSAFAGIAPAVTKITGVGITAGLAIREKTRERQELEHRLRLTPLEHAATTPEYGVAPLISPMPIQAVGVQERVKLKQALKMELEAIPFMGEISTPAPPPRRIWAIPLKPLEKEKRPKVRGRIPKHQDVFRYMYENPVRELELKFPKGVFRVGLEAPRGKRSRTVRDPLMALLAPHKRRKSGKKRRKR